mmetsp:Transcript_45607/g.66846  ORF Transcript_45607/g.66846 Transcript_45607/m.66846 type:complete len:206 (-) Transcript_45607:1688-2305(-)
MGRVQEHIDARAIHILETPHIKDVNAGILGVGTEVVVEHVDRLLKRMVLVEKLLRLRRGGELEDKDNCGNEPGDRYHGNHDTRFHIEDHGRKFGPEKQLDLVALHFRPAVAAGSERLLGGRGVRQAAVAALRAAAAEARAKGRRDVEAARRRLFETVVVDHNGRAKHGHDKDVVGRDDCCREHAKRLRVWERCGEAGEEGSACCG